MSGRSAHVRKKKSDAKGSSSHRPNTSANSSLHDASSNSTIDSPASPIPVPAGTGIGTTNARFLRFADSSVDVSYDGTSPSWSTSPGFRDYDRSRRTTRIGSPGGGGLDDYHYYGGGGGDWYGSAGSAHRTEGVSGIEKSGLRSVIDRKSDDVRKGIAKTFMLGRKKSREDKGKGLEISLGRGGGGGGGSDRSSEHGGYHPRNGFFAEEEDREIYGSPRAEHNMCTSPPHHGAPVAGNVGSSYHGHQHLADPWDAMGSRMPLPSPPPLRELPPLPPHARKGH